MQLPERLPSTSVFINESKLPEVKAGEIHFVAGDRGVGKFEVKFIKRHKFKNKAEAEALKEYVFWDCEMVTGGAKVVVHLGAGDMKNGIVGEIDPEQDME